MRPTIWILLMAVGLWPVSAASTTITASDMDGDATLFLAVEDTLFLSGPNPDWCLVRITVTGDDVSLTAGDSILVWVFEDDVVADDLVFQMGFEVSAGEAAAQRVDQTFDCSEDPAGFHDGIGQFAEIFAEAVVKKDECGAFCFFDRPQSSILQVTILEGATSTPTLRAEWLGDAIPNPFNPSTTISYSVPRETPGELVIYDLAGRRVRTLVSGTLYPGTKSATWNGQDDGGAQVASGVYLYQLRAGEYLQTKRMVLLK